MPNSRKNTCLEILWIDDDADILEICGRSLRSYGMVVHLAKTGSLGLKMLSEKNVDVVVCDLEMSEMDGLQVAAKVHEIFNQNVEPRPLFVVLTAWSTKFSCDDATQGYIIDAVFQKPIEMKRLLEAIYSLVAERNRRTGQPV